MKNMGLATLRIVGEVPGLSQPGARALAYGAWDVLDGAIAEERLSEAVRRSTLVVGTSGRAGTGAWTPRQLAAEGLSRAGPGPLSVVFGPEASGLTGEELALCHVTVHIPTHSAQPSLNLAQAVLLVAYELRLAVAGPRPQPEPERASAGELEAALAGLAEGLLGIGYLSPQNPGLIVAELRRLIARARPTQREVTLLRGMGRQIQWAARRIANGPPGTDNLPSPKDAKHE